jgi:hypothetical protein
MHTAPAPFLRIPADDGTTIKVMSERHGFPPLGLAAGCGSTGNRHDLGYERLWVRW